MSRLLAMPELDQTSQNEALLGREREIADVRLLLDTDRPIAVVGEAGIGKTSLIRAAALGSGRSLRQGGGFATLAWMPYLALRRATGQDVRGDVGEAARAVERAIGPDLLFVDDLQWVDPDSSAVVAMLAGRVSLIVAIREGDPGTSGALELVESARARLVHLGALAGEAASAIARRTRPDLSDSAVRGVVRRGGGNPLLIEELALRGAGSSSLARAIAAQLDGLTALERRAAEILAVADGPMPAAALGPPGHRLIELHLAVRDETMVDDIALRHALIAEAIRATLSDQVRATVHLLVADAVRSPLERARHLHDGGRTVEASQVALKALANETDPTTRARLLALAAGTDNVTLAAQLRVEAAIALRAIGDAEAALTLLEPEIVGSHDLQALRAATLVSTLSDEGRMTDAWAEIERARQLRPNPTSSGATALARAEASLIVNTGGSEQAAIETLQEAAAAFRGETAPYSLRASLETQLIFSGRSTDTQALRGVWLEAVAAGDGGAVADLGIGLHYAVLMTQGGRPALDCIREAIERLTELGYAARADELRAEACQVSIFAGDLSGTVILADTALEQPLGLRPRQRGMYMRAFALTMLGRFDDAQSTLGEVVGFATDDFDGLGSVRWVQAELALWSGRPDRVAALIAEAIEKPALSRHEYILPSLTLAWAARDLGRAPSPLPESDSSRALAGAIPEHRGLTAAARNDHHAAQAAFLEAAETWAGVHITREPLSRWAAGEAAREAGRLDDAIASYEAALEQAIAIGFEPLASRIRRSLRLSGRRIAVRSERSGGGLLTAREREIAALAARGLTNVEIARRMGLGRPTVARLLSNAMLKLDARSRSQLGVLADLHG